MLEPLSMYGTPSDRPAPSWSWVAGQLADAGTYWVVARGARHPHPRPVWGVWDRHRLLLSIGSPTIARELERDPTVTVHLDSGTDVVIVEGRARGPSVEPSILERYDAKYDWDYDVSQYGPLTVVVPSTVIAWRSAGWAGREGFQATARWRFPDEAG